MSASEILAVERVSNPFYRDHNIKTDFKPVLPRPFAPLRVTEEDSHHCSFFALRV